jgi:hypothetical protein
MADLTNHNDLTEWLRSQPREILIIIAARAALRVFPLLERAFNQPGKDKVVSRNMILPVIRLLAIPIAAAKYGTKSELIYHAENAISNSIRAQSSNQDSTIFQSIGVAARAATATTSAHLTRDCAEFAVHTLETSEVANNSYYDLFQGAIAPYGFSAVGMDAEFVRQGGTPKELIAKNLWLAGVPIFTQSAWKQLKAVLNDLDENWDVWIKWYDAILKGQPTSGGEQLDIFRVTLNSEEDWKKGSARINALIKSKEDEITVPAELSASTSITFAATGNFTTAAPKFPKELDGPSWDVNHQTGMLSPAFRKSNQTESEIIDMESQRPFLFECAQSLVTAIATSTSNSVGQLLPAAERYLLSIENNSSLVSIAEVYAAGVRLRNLHDRIRREVENEGMPDVAINIGEAMDSVIGLHGPFILATACGREMNARARDDNRTKSQELAYKAKSLEFAEALKKSNGLVTDGGKNFIVEINSEISTGPHPERSTMLAEASNHNLLVTASSVIAVEYSKAVLLDTVAGNAVIGIGTNNANIAINWMIVNASLLFSLAATSPETLYWLPHFLRWLQAWYDTSRN